jgi:gamma-D-glutamyl-L-lysine dipeptidyl-peptidase
MLFGETYEILEQNENWLRIKMRYDGYEGWIDSNNPCLISEDEANEADNSKILTSLTAFASSSKRCIRIHCGSNIPFYKYGKFRIGEEKFELEYEKTGLTSARKIAFQFLETPYLWGGRLSFGIDCSGLVQIAFKAAGINLPRDAYQQSEIGEEVFFEDAKAGDVAFFHNDKGRIIHTGILLEKNKIIHASYKVRIDDFTEKGIFNNELDKFSHNLKVIKRIV